MTILSKTVTRTLPSRRVTPVQNPLKQTSTQNQMDILNLSQSKTEPERILEPLPKQKPEPLPDVFNIGKRNIEEEDASLKRRISLFQDSDPPIKAKMDEFVPSADARKDVVDMRKGGRVGAAVVAASLMANGGQAISNQMDQLMSEGGEIQHMKGLPLDIFNRHFTRLVKNGLANPEYRQQALQNFDKFTDEVFKIESSKNWNAKNKYGFKGGYQFGDNDVDMTLNRLQRHYKDVNDIPAWVKNARKHKDASRLTPEQQTALFVTNMFERSLRDDKGNILKGEGDKLLVGAMEGDKGDMIDSYYKLHYASSPDLPTRFRTNVVFRFGDDWENRIFGWAKKAKDIKNKYLN
tara:strand:- start:6 stop:1055 length:1050 start_codon:yes stop_codon:yes gene_type:complete